MTNFSGTPTVPSDNLGMVNGSESTTISRVKNGTVAGSATSVMNATIGMVGILGNALTISVILFHKPLRKKFANYFFLNQSILNLLASLILVLNNTAPLVASPNLSLTGLVLYCRLWYSKAFFLGLFLPSLLTMVALTVERYMKILHPIKQHLKMTRLKVFLILIGVNFGGLIFKSSFIISSNMVTNGACGGARYPNSASKKAVGIANFFVEYLIPIGVVGFCYIRMAMSLKISRRIKSDSIGNEDGVFGKIGSVGGGFNFGGGSGGGSGGGCCGRVESIPRPPLIRARNNIIKTLFISIVVFVVCMSYKEFLLLLQYFDAIVVDFTSLEFQVANVMAYGTCCVDPVIYFANYEEFQRGFCKLFCRKQGGCFLRNEVGAMIVQDIKVVYIKSPRKVASKLG